MEKVKLSKTLSFITRHGAKDKGIYISDDGYILIKDFIDYIKNNRGFDINIDQIKDIVDNCSKQRFEIKGDKCEYIRASQGHSSRLDVDVPFKNVVSHHEIPIVIHGTFSNKIQTILGNGLSKMDRQYIHFTQGQTDGIPSGIPSGIRKNSNVLIYIDTKKAMDDGIEFKISNNNVILSNGKNGIIDSKYFLKIKRL
jgi:2'-phosphotransferase